MKVGLNITDNVHVNIKESIDSLIESLDKYKITYKIPYNKTENNNGIQIILIDSFGLEIRTYKNIIYGIRCSNIKLNRFIIVDTESKVSLLSQMIDAVEKNFGVNRKDIIISRYKALSKSAVVTIPIDDEFIKISLVPSEDGIAIEYIEVMNK